MMAEHSGIAYLFPGQGSQSVGMSRSLLQEGSAVASIFEEASEVLGYDIGRLCQEGPAEQLNQTEFTQPALFVTSWATFQLMQDCAWVPAAVAGHSLGEYTALVAGGGLAFQDAVGLVQKRGRYMAEAVLPGTGLVAALLGLSEQDVREVCREAESTGVVAPANLNAPGQTVIAGEKAAVEKAIDLAKARGAKRALPLPVSVPVHTPLMQVAADRLKKDIDSLSWSDLKVPLINNVEARAIQSAGELQVSLVKQLPSPVQWQESIMTMSRMGVHHFIEIGPGKVLTGLVKRIVPDAQTWNISDRASYDHVRTQLAAFHL